MHVYYKYKVYLKNYGESLNREIECRSITSLGIFAASLMATFKASGKKNFYFDIKDQIYECYEGLKLQPQTNIHHSIDIALSRIDPKKFMFVYDYDQKYEFVIEKIGEGDDATWKKAPEVVSGTGFGILEDNRRLLIKYIRGGITFKELQELANCKKFNEISDYSFDNSIVKYYNDYNKIKKKRIEKD